MNKYTLNQYLKFLVPIFIALSLVGYYHRFPTGDDGWFAEQSYWLLKSGKIKSEFFNGLLGWNKQIFVSHKLFLLYGSGLMSLLGNNLYSFQVSSLVFLIIVIALFYIYIKQRNLDSFLLLLFLLFANILVIKMSFEFRPEIMLMTLGFGSYLCIQSKKLYLIFLGGILAGLTVLCHLNGIIYIIAGATMLLITKQNRAALVFTLSAGFVSLFYFLDVFMADAWNIWFYQFENDPATKNAMELSGKLKVLLNYLSIFVKSPKEMACTILLLSFIFASRKQLNKLPKNIVIYSLALFFSFWLITKRASGIYQILFLPSIFILILEMKHIIEENIPKIVLAGLVIYLVIGSFGQFQLIYKNNTQVYAPDKFHELAKKLPPHSNGFVPTTFYFNEYSRYNKLRCYDNYHFQNDKTSLGTWCKANRLDFILLDYKNFKSDFLPKPKEKINNYALSYYDGDYAIYFQVMRHPINEQVEYEH